LEIEAKPGWLAGLRTWLKTLPMWVIWLLFFVVLLAPGEIIKFFLKKDLSISIDNTATAALTALGLSFFHWLDRK
jgi:hypothetical protein